MATGIGKQIAGFDVWWGDYHLQELLDECGEEDVIVISKQNESKTTFKKTLENISYYLDWPVVIACIVRQIIMKIITANIQSGVGKRQVVEHIPRVKHEAEHGN